jgi:glucose/arabinose dehydrogenase
MRRLWVLVVLGAVLALAGGCLAPPPTTVTPVVANLSIPWDVQWTPDGTMLFTERSGEIEARVGGQVRVLADPADVVAASESGMLGLAVDPQFAANRYIYTCFASTRGGPDNDVRLVRWKVNASSTALTDRADIVTGMPVNTNGELGRHSGCRPRFGPDGALWVGTGDAAVGSVPQSKTSLGGKVLRVDRNGAGVAPNPGVLYPASGFDPRIYTYGHRNVQGIAFRPDGKAYAVEHGSYRDDEVNLLVPGGNYGWNPVVGANPAYNESVPMTDLVEFPNAKAAVWSSGPTTIATSGAVFLTGTKWGTWNGMLVIACLKGEQLLGVKLDAAGTKTVGTATTLTDRGRLRTPAVGPGGNLFVTTANGSGDSILQVAPKPAA